MEGVQAADEGSRKLERLRPLQRRMGDPLFGSQQPTEHRLHAPAAAKL